MTPPEPHLIEITVEYERPGLSRFIRALAVPGVALMVAGALLFSTGGSSSHPAVVPIIPTSPCTIGTIPRVEAGYRPEIVHGGSFPQRPPGCR